MKNSIKPPLAKKVRKQLSMHGENRIDNYYWMNNREDEEVIAHLKAENEYTKAILKDTESFQDKLYEEIIGRIKQTDMSVPVKENGYYYYVRYEAGKEYPVYCRKKESLDNAEEIILNVNEMAEGHDYYQVAGYSISPDNKMMAFGVDTVSRRIYEVYFKNLETGEILSKTLKNTSGNASWANDNKTLFYAEKDETTLRPERIYRYVLTESKEPELVFEEKDETFWSYVYKSRSKKYIIIGSSATLSDEYHILDANNPMGKFKLVQSRERNLEYSIAHYKEKLYIRTNYRAKNFSLMETPVTNTEKENWKVVIPGREKVFFEGFIVFEDFLVMEERHQGLLKIKIQEFATGNEHYINFGEQAYTCWIGANPEYKTTILRYGYSSLATPISTYEYDMNKHSKELLKRQEVVGGHKPEDYHSERLMAKATDGTEIPISLVYKKSTIIDGTAPLLLYAYGSYGHSMDPYFSSPKLSLLDRGFIYAIAHIRGGQELGRDWYDDGKLLKKENTFTDFIACAKYLIDKNYTNSSKLMAMGGSAGGLLMGVVVNTNPELFKGVIAAVPFVDVVTTMLDETIPLTTGEYDEWGNPNDKQYYDYMLSYSPYDNVREIAYPNMLVTSGLHDSQVQYWEPTKWVAKLREMKTDNKLLLLHTNMDAGHGGASGRFQKHKETALEYAFMFKLLGVNETSK